MLEEGPRSPAPVAVYARKQSVWTADLPLTIAPDHAVTTPLYHIPAVTDGKPAQGFIPARTQKNLPQILSRVRRLHRFSLVRTIILFAGKACWGRAWSGTGATGYNGIYSGQTGKGQTFLGSADRYFSRLVSRAR
jgi:hypothetical protein